MKHKIELSTEENFIVCIALTDRTISLERMANVFEEGNPIRQAFLDERDALEEVIERIRGCRVRASLWGDKE